MLLSEVAKTFDKGVLNAEIAKYDYHAAKKAIPALSQEGQEQLEAAIELAKAKVLDAINSSEHTRKNWAAYKKWEDTHGTKFLRMSEETWFMNLVKIGKPGSDLIVQPGVRDPGITISPELAEIIRNRFIIKDVANELKEIRRGHPPVSKTFMERMRKLATILKK